MNSGKIFARLRLIRKNAAGEEQAEWGREGGRKSGQC